MSTPGAVLEHVLPLFRRMRVSSFIGTPMNLANTHMFAPFKTHGTTAPNKEIIISQIMPVPILRVLHT